MADDLGADLDQLPCSSKVGYGSTAVYPRLTRERQRWVVSGPSPRRIKVQALQVAETQPDEPDKVMSRSAPVR